MDYLAGQLVLLANLGDWVPVGMLLCDGRLINITDNVVLFSLIGTKFGGNGTTNFSLPDLRGQSPDGTYYCMVSEGIYPRRP